jgi:type III secretion system YscQ/HrcQ family protein
MAVRPFPYASLPKLTRRQNQLLAALRTHWGRAQSERVRSTASGLLGRELSWELGLGDSCSAEELRARCASTAGVAVLIEQAQIARPITCIVELTHQAAQQLVDLTLGGDAETASCAGLVPLDELSRGALAYLVARMLAALNAGWTLSNILELSQLQAAMVEASVVYPLCLKLGTVLLHVRAYVPDRLAIQGAPERIAVRSLHALRVTLSASAGRARLAMSTLAELGRGDIIVLEETALVREGDRWRGQARAGLLGSKNHLQCVLEEQALRVQGYAHALGKELAMTTGTIQKASVAAETTGSATSNIASDAPIELQVEIARFSLSLGELQRLQTGDVLVTGRKIGERVSVQVAGQTFAEGELVDVEGEVGVRLLSFNDHSER